MQEKEPAWIQTICGPTTERRRQSSCAHLQVVSIISPSERSNMRLIFAIGAVLAAALTTAHASPILHNLRTCLAHDAAEFQEPT